jgi:mxaJ protein
MTPRPLCALAAALLGLAGCSGGKTLTVCADPNNMPFSNQRGEGIENKVAEIVARDLGRKLEFYWWAQRRGFVRNTFGQGKCDAWFGVVSGFERMTTTRPYYRSSFAFVTRSADELGGLTLDDPRLRKLKVGVQLAGDDGANPPPAAALARRGIVANVRGFPLYGDYREANPPAAILRAVERGEIDVAMVWGPLAGWYALHAKTPLRVEPVTQQTDPGNLPMSFAISVGVQRDQHRLANELDEALARNREAISQVLAAYDVSPAGG